MMNNVSKRKSISLFLIIFIILLIVVLVILANKLLQNNNSSETENTAPVEISIESNDNTSTFNNVENISDFNEISTTTENPSNTSTSNNQISTTNQALSNSNKITLNNHSYVFDGTINASVVQDNSKSAIQFLYPDFNYKMLFNTDSSISFNALKNNTSLKSFLESTYNFKITSDLKTGTVNNLNLIVFTISDDIGIGYCIFAPLNNSEVAYTKIYNTSDITKLIPDLSNPLNEFSSVIASIVN